MVESSSKARMKSLKINIIEKCCGIIFALACILAATLKAQDLYVVNNGSNKIGEYRLDGSTVNASLISGLNYPQGIAISGTNLFVSSYGNGTIGKYTTSGTVVNASLISGLDYPQGIAISGTNLFVANYGNDTIGEYTTSGTVVNASLISGFDSPSGIAISGTNLFIPNSEGTTVGEYTTSGATVSAALISVVGGSPSGIAILGSDLFVVNVNGTGTIGEYTTSGATVNASLGSIPNLGTPAFVAISPSPPVLSLGGFSNGQFQMAVLGSNNETYTVRMATNLLSKNWVSLAVTNPPSGSFLFTDPNATNKQRFYRVEMAQ